jgi:glycosyltransferase involved in cell wall biosynthesis
VFEASTRLTLRVSVIIPSYQSATLVGRAVDSVLAQSIKPGEIIVIDDGSTDDTVERLRRYGDQITVLTKPNGGVASARNAGAAIATGDVLAFLDADDTWKVEKLEVQIREFERTAGLGFVTCGMEEVDDAGRVVCHRLEGRAGWVAEDMVRLTPTVVGPGSTMVVPRKIFHEFGGFDEMLPPSEDWELCYRIACRYPAGFVRRILATYHIHGSNAHLNPRRMERSMLRTWHKIFANAPANIAPLRRQSYSQLYMILAGDFFAAGFHLPALKYATKSIWLSPRKAAYVASYPRRWLRRRTVDIR